MLSKFKIFLRGIADVLPHMLSVIPFGIITGAIGVEFASFFAQMGSDVSLLESKPTILPNEDLDVSNFVEKQFLKRGIKVYKNHSLLSLKEKKVFEEDTLLFQSIYRFEFDDNGILVDQKFLTADNFNKIAFSSDETKVERNAYGITDQLYDAFTRGQ